MLKQSLQQKLLQKLSPQQIQMIKLLEIPSMQLDLRIKKELEENPLLEEGPEEDIYEESDNMDDTDIDTDPDKDEFSLEDYMDDDEIPSYKLEARNYSKDDKKEDIPFSVGNTFHDYLESQLHLRNMDKTKEALANYLIGNIDEDGYLRRDLNAIVDDLAFSANIVTTEEQLAEALKEIQDMEPPGVGARNLQECLKLQLIAKESDHISIKLALQIIEQYFDAFTKKHYDKIINRLNISEEDFREALNEILKLNPKPGSAYNDPGNKSAQQITPDFYLENDEGDLQLQLHGKNIPDLRISRAYNQMLGNLTKGKNKGNKDMKEATSFVKQKLESAKWFIDAIKQRQTTLLVTMNAIINYQKEFFQEGDETRLKPMILKDIADVTGLDISTISRVANSKYIQTYFGIYPLKYFFSEGMQTDSGEEVSTREIKKILGDCIMQEDKRKPITDEKLAAILKEKGYPIARRTVAKYREQLNIPVARLRKEI